MARPSPDGRWLAYMSEESGRPQVYVRPLSAGPRAVVSNSGGSWPLWGREGQELFYVAPDGSIMAVTMKLGVRIDTTIPKALFKLAAGAPRSPFSTVDGQRFLVRLPAVSAAPAITWVINWPAVLKK
jgi:eukaryotic-like serine/threonine-protein kinase